MLTITILNIIVVFLGFFSRYKKLRWLFKVSFLIIFLFTAIRYDFGKDYMNYFDLFIRIVSDISFNNFNFENYRVENAWIILNYLFKDIGFSGLIIFISAIFCYTYYDLIKKHVDPQYYWLAIFVYVFTFNIMWIQFSAIRQALAIIIFIYAVKFIIYNSETNSRFTRRLNNISKPFIYISLILFAGLIHKSAYLMLPIVLFSFEKIRGNNFIGILIISAFLFLLFFEDTSIHLMQESTSLIIDDDRYLDNFDLETSASTSIIGLATWLSFLIMILYYSRFRSKNMKFLFYLSSFYYFIYLLSPIVKLSARMGFYFSPFLIIVFPVIIKNIKNPYIKYFILSFIIFFTLYNLNKAFTNTWIIDGYTEYKTIFYKD